MDGVVIKTSIPEEPEEAAITVLSGDHFHIGLGEMSKGLEWCSVEGRAGVED